MNLQSLTTNQYTETNQYSRNLNVRLTCDIYWDLTESIPVLRYQLQTRMYIGKLLVVTDNSKPITIITITFENIYSRLEMNHQTTSLSEHTNKQYQKFTNDIHSNHPH